VQVDVLGGLAAENKAALADISNFGGEAASSSSAALVVARR
jgi:hypothetical protein